MPEQLLLLDFDRTLFDTARFVERLWNWLAKHYGIDAEHEKSRVAEFSHHVGDMYSYDFFGHVAALAIDGQSISRRAHQELADENFLYPDASAALVLSPQILTFGNEPYQRFKLDFCPELADIKSTIIEEPKELFIARTLPDTPVVLVDDKLLRTLPPNLRFVHLDRQQTSDIIDHDKYVSIKSLEHLRRML